jgi:hypothetical protein
MKSLRLFAVVASLAAATGCGGAVTASPTSRPDGSVADHMPDAGPGFDAGPDAGWTTCSDPEGLQLCGGPNHCAASDPNCQCVAPPDAGGRVGACFGFDIENPCPACQDGEICVDWIGVGYPTYSCTEVNTGVLFAKNGASNRVRYADLGLWTGAPLPAPKNCPSLDIPICGGNCGGCGLQQICTGRSPLHPYGFCVSQTATLCSRGPGTGCAFDEKCFVFKVQPAAQSVADQYGVCLKSALCSQVASELPGGGTCYSPGG